MKHSERNEMRGRKIGAYLLILVSAVAFFLTLWRYMTPLSGVTGTSGALLAMFGAFMLIIAGILLTILPRGGLRLALLILSWIGILGTLLAMLFLHGWLAAIAIAIGALALIIEMFASTKREFA